MDSLSPSPPNRSVEINILKAIAALLIINSHLEHLYPKSWMALDGLLGNTIFFFTTGFTLAGSLSRSPSPSFFRFLLKRLARLFPAVWLVVFILDWQSLDFTSPSSIIGTLIYPTKFSFVALIVPLYPLFYIFLRLVPKARPLLVSGSSIAAASCALLAWRIHCMGAAPVQWSAMGGFTYSLHFFDAMILGAALQRLQPFRIHPPALSVAAISAALATLYLLLRFAASSAAPLSFASLARPFVSFSFPLCVASIIAGYIFLLTGIPNQFISRRLAARIVSFLSKHSWETYLLHLSIAQWSFVKMSGFPLSVFATFTLTLGLAPVLHRFSNAAPLFFSSRRAPI